MNVAPETKEWRDFVELVCYIARGKMHLHEWVVNYTFEKKNKRDKNNKRVYYCAEVIAMPSYVEASLFVYPRLKTKYYDKKDYWSVVQVLCHEMSHLLTQRMYDQAHGSFTGNIDDLNHEHEALTSRIGNIITAIVWPEIQAHGLPK